VLLIPKRHRQTDRQTDRRTDGRLTVALPRSALASRGKKNPESSSSSSSSSGMKNALRRCRVCHVHNNS